MASGSIQMMKKVKTDEYKSFLFIISVPMAQVSYRLFMKTRKGS